MKLHFEPDLGYPMAAIEAVSDLFRGQEIYGKAHFKAIETREKSRERRCGQVVV